MKCKLCGIKKPGKRDWSDFCSKGCYRLYNERSKSMTGIELENLEHQAQIITENHIKDLTAVEKETNTQPHHFKSYQEFFHASQYGIEKCSKMWTGMIAMRDKWVEV